MKFIPQSIPDVVLIEPEVYEDGRGYFTETFRQDKFEQAIGVNIRLVQDSESKSSRGVLRGLHFQLPPFEQSKLVRVVKGRVLDVAVDIRKNSPSFGKHISLELNESNKNQLFLPVGFAHGFVVLSEIAILSYKLGNYYSPEHEKGLAFDDKGLDIDWLLPRKQLILSKKDQNYPTLSQIKSHF